MCLCVFIFNVSGSVSVRERGEIRQINTKVSPIQTFLNFITGKRNSVCSNCCLQGNFMVLSRANYHLQGNLMVLCCTNCRLQGHFMVFCHANCRLRGNSTVLCQARLKLEEHYVISVYGN